MQYSKFILVLYIFFLFAEKSFSLPKDTLSYQAKESVVFGKRLSQIENQEYIPMSMIEKEEIEILSTRQLTDAMKLSPGINIVDYGGLGGLKTISSRGFGSSRTGISIEGIRINNQQTGTIDFSTIPSAFIESIEISRGGQALIFGGNSLAGSVNLKLIKPTIEAYKFNIGIGSFGETQANASLDFNNESYGAALFFETLSYEGNYPFNFNNFGENQTFKRENSNFDNNFIATTGYLKLKNISTNYALFFRNTNRGSPGAVLQNRIENNTALMKEDDFNFLTSTNIQVNENAVFEVASYLNFNNNKYLDDELYFLGFEEGELASKGNNLIFHTKYSSCGENSFYFIKSEFAATQFNGNMLESQRFTGDVQRFNSSLTAFYSVDIFNKFSVFMASRIDYFNDFGTVVLPSLGVKFQSDFYQLRANLSRDFRQPSFNEMYYFNFGNNNLKPESAWSFNIGNEYNLLNILLIDANIFYTNANNMILSVPVSPIRWSAQNIAETNSYGIEIATQGNLSLINSTFRIAYTYQQVRDNSNESLSFGKQLIYAPFNLLSIYLNSVVIDDFTIWVNPQYTGHRYSLPDNSRNSLLNSFWVLNTGLDYKINLTERKLRFRIELNNITNSEYQLINNFPMPGRFFRLTTSLEM